MTAFGMGPRKEDHLSGPEAGDLPKLQSGESSVVPYKLTVAREV